MPTVPWAPWGDVGATSSAEPLAGRNFVAEPLAGRVLLVPHAESLTGTLLAETRKPELAF